MIYNAVKMNNRDYLDYGDIKTGLLTLVNVTRMDGATVATIVKFLDYISEAFHNTQPKDNVVTPTSVIDYSLISSMDETYRENQKIAKKNRKNKKQEAITGIIDLEPPKPVEEVFSSMQVNQLNTIIDAQNKLLQELLVEQTKAFKSMLPDRTEPETKKATKTKKETAA
ncbi:MAG: hypothetical protein K2P14_03865 [Anaeroplasmataceae bacterium]|nr:hypothetical protein [Anaeroplasmataceae bacterium]